MSNKVTGRVGALLKPLIIEYRLSPRSEKINPRKKSENVVMLCCKLKRAMYRFVIIVLVWLENLRRHLVTR